MPGLPVAQVVGVDRDRGLVRYDVVCPYCHQVHHHQWHGTDTAFAVTAPCAITERYRVQLPGRDDNAADTPYEHNWIE
jgi:hypothetical protein